MARYIDADVLCRHFKILYEHAQTNGLYNHAKLYDRVVRFVVDAPTEDVVEVVRCKDCKHCTLTEDGEYNPEDIVCGYFMTDGMQAYDYCSYGERKE